MKHEMLGTKDAASVNVTNMQTSEQEYKPGRLVFDPDMIVPTKHKMNKEHAHRQVGGDHYEKYSIMPWDIIDEYNLDFYTGNIIKYLLRDKGSKLEDLKKAQHYLTKLITLHEQRTDNQTNEPGTAG